MSSLTQFQKFAKKGNSNLEKLSSNAVIYTRVSTKEQAETNLSLETQKKHCIDYATKNNLHIVEYFGGTYESAKTDERKEFNRMLTFVKKQKLKISYIIVFSIDRFSRSGSNAIYISEQLKKQGIHILSVTQNIETLTPAGKFQQNMFFMFSQVDNDMRRDKTMAGMREMLRQRHWATKAPIGYSHLPSVNKDGRIVIDEKGKLLKKAFMWKAEEGVSNMEIVSRLQKLGLKITKQRLTEIFKNPFYCGIIVSKLIEDEVIKGKHPKLISEEIFLKVNELQSKNNHGYKQQKEQSNFPLKQFVKCDSCGTPLTAYRVKNKKAEYYKCNKIGCPCNRNSMFMHNLFAELLGEYTVDAKAIPPLQHMMSYTFRNLNELRINDKEAYTKALKACEEKINMIQERFVLGEIDNELYEKFIDKYRSEKKELEVKVSECSFELSNLYEYVNFTLKLPLNLPSAWGSADYQSKLKLQNLIFPEGIRFNKEKNNYRTSRVNVLFDTIRTLSSIYPQKRSGLSNKFVEKSALVDQRLQKSNFLASDIEAILNF